MSDPAAELRPELKTMLRADAGVAQTFGAKPLQVVDFAGPNLSPPYVILGDLGGSPQLAECIDGAETDITLHVFSRSEPPGYAEAAGIARAVEVAVLSSDLQLASHRICNVERVSGRYLTDPDTVTAHAVLTFRFHTEAL